jgi:RNA polymerase sigma factor (sigma-70 family)
MEPTEELIERAKKGDRDAFGALIQPVLASGFRLAAGILRDRHAAEDATQDAVLTAWRKLGNLRSGAPLEPWFLAIVANRCRKVWHHRNRQTVIPDRYEPDHGFVGQVADRLAIHEALEHLTPQQRLLVILRYYFDLPLDETARIAAIPLGTAKSRLHRALTSLRLDLTEMDTGYGRNRTS